MSGARTLPGLTRGTARFSPCGTWRYYLSRELGGERGRYVAILCNPSTADESVDDPTVRRVTGFARRWGASRLEVLNAFAFRATDPRRMHEAAARGVDVVGPENDATILDVCAGAGIVVCGWGVNGELLGRGPALAARLSDAGVTLNAWKLTAAGHPGHPLYLPGRDGEVSAFVRRFFSQ